MVSLVIFLTLNWLKKEGKKERERESGDIYNNKESQAIFSWQATSINPLYNACFGVKLMKIPLIVIHRTCLLNVKTLTVLKETLSGPMILTNKCYYLL